MFLRSPNLTSHFHPVPSANRTTVYSTPLYSMSLVPRAEHRITPKSMLGMFTCVLNDSNQGTKRDHSPKANRTIHLMVEWKGRSEERRVGKSVDLCGRRIIKKKNGR